ncbi:MAG: NUDIX domain-containing protein [Anaerolineaceae bacterium]|nr:NUDIX domain-containing protein [Anaerolineaceae bacterium]MBN2677036.1 NUDIX domain-containing protein [Anaerolineaceae bacterium]
MRAPNRVVGVVIRDGKLLLIHRLRDGTESWVFPGGNVDPGEDPDITIQRKILEATALNPASQQRLFEEYDEHAFTWYFYACELEPGEPHLIVPEWEPNTPENNKGLEWVDLNQIKRVNPHPLPDQLLDYFLKLI